MGGRSSLGKCVIGGILYSHLSDPTPTEGDLLIDLHTYSLSIGQLVHPTIQISLLELTEISKRDGLVVVLSLRQFGSLTIVFPSNGTHTLAMETLTFVMTHPRLIKTAASSHHTSNPPSPSKPPISEVIEKTTVKVKTGLLSWSVHEAQLMACSQLSLTPKAGPNPQTQHTIHIPVTHRFAFESSQESNLSISAKHNDSDRVTSAFAPMTIWFEDSATRDRWAKLLNGIQNTELQASSTSPRASSQHSDGTKTTHPPSPHPPHRMRVSITIERAKAVPSPSGLRATPYVTVSGVDGDTEPKMSFTHTTTTKRQTSDPVFNETFDLGHLSPSTTITLTLCTAAIDAVTPVLGSVTVRVSSFIQNPRKRRLVIGPNEEVLTKPSRNSTPCELFFRGDVVANTAPIAERVEEEVGGKMENGEREGGREKGEKEEGMREREREEGEEEPSSNIENGPNQAAVENKTQAQEAHQQSTPSLNADEPISESGHNHVFMLTRGTQGDIQPFVALARGIAEQNGDVVTICTELRYRDFIVKNAKVRRGRVQFRPSGGDTPSRIDSRMAQWAMAQSRDFMQSIMLARSEVEFFSSEPVAMHWMRTLISRPTCVVFGFTMTNIAVILSEVFRVPLVGFILQPSVIPSDAYPAITPINSPGGGITTSPMSLFPSMLDVVSSRHSTQSMMRAWMENNPLNKSQSLNTRRRSYGLKPFLSNSSETWPTLLHESVPVIVPISPVAFGPTPPDWSQCTQLTDFIFLRPDPPTQPQLHPHLTVFLSHAKERQWPVVVLSFSSMPVPRGEIMELVEIVLTQTNQKMAVIALVGKGHSSAKAQCSPALESKVLAWKHDGRLFEDSGAPFGALFPQVDCVVIHGGLGSTAEALRAGVPILVTGILLLDQRFWGQRVHELKCGPAPVHINEFPSVCAKLIDRAVVCREWSENAKRVAEDLREGMRGDEAGIEANVSAFNNMLRLAKPLEIL